jgi:hypothetical protein
MYDQEHTGERFTEVSDLNKNINKAGRAQGAVLTLPSPASSEIIRISPHCGALSVQANEQAALV